MFLKVFLRSTQNGYAIFLFSKSSSSRIYSSYYNFKKVRLPPRVANNDLVTSRQWLPGSSYIILDLVMKCIAYTPFRSYIFLPMEWNIFKQYSNEPGKLFSNFLLRMTMICTVILFRRNFLIFVPHASERQTRSLIIFYTISKW